MNKTIDFKIGNKIMLFVFLSAILLLTGCVTAEPKTKVDLQSVSSTDWPIVQQGRFPFPYKKVFDSAIMLLESESWTVIDIKRDDGIIKTGAKTDYMMGTNCDIVCRIIEFETNVFSVKWLYTETGEDLFGKEINSKAMPDNLQSQWNYLLLKTIRGL